jgi:hypothetical protein
VTSDAVYEFLTAFLTEMAQIFVDPVMMLGGDEVGLDTRDPVTGAPLLLACFDLDPKASAWLKSHDMLSANVTAYFWKRVTTEVVPKVKRTAMVWFGMPSTGDPPLAQLPASTIANVWYVPTKEARAHTHVRVSLAVGQRHEHTLCRRSQLDCTGHLFESIALPSSGARLSGPTTRYTTVIRQCSPLTRGGTFQAPHSVDLLTPSDKEEWSRE